MEPILEVNNLTMDFGGLRALDHLDLEIGQGDIDFAAMHAAFMVMGYDGYYVVDLFRIGDDPAGYEARSLKALIETFS